MFRIYDRAQIAARIFTIISCRHEGRVRLEKDDHDDMVSYTLHTMRQQTLYSYITTHTNAAMNFTYLLIHKSGVG